MMIKPPRLVAGATLGIVAPASAPANPRNVDRVIAAVERLGFKPKPARNLNKRWGFLAGTDEERAADLMEAFTDTSVAGIICLRGGYGAARLLPRLDYQAITRIQHIFISY